MSKRRNDILVHAVLLTLGLLAWQGEKRWMLIALAVGMPLAALVGIAVGTLQKSPRDVVVHKRAALILVAVAGAGFMTAIAGWWFLFHQGGR